MSATTHRNPRELVQPAVQANKEHQYALKVYTERLEAELEHLDKLLVSGLCRVCRCSAQRPATKAATEVSDNEDEDILVSKTGGTIAVPGAVKPRGPFHMSELMDEVRVLYGA